jgi:hypothetical protein
LSLIANHPRDDQQRRDDDRDRACGQAPAPSPRAEDRSRDCNERNEQQQILSSERCDAAHDSKPHQTIRLHPRRARYDKRAVLRSSPTTATLSLIVEPSVVVSTGSTATIAAANTPARWFTNSRPSHAVTTTVTMPGTSPVMRTAVIPAPNTACQSA